MEKCRLFQCILLIILCFAFIESSAEQKKKQKTEKGGAAMNVTSSAFNEGGMIPPQYTCDGVNISPPLAWSNSPETTKSFALICDDPDAPMGTWVHWVMYNIPSKAKELAENVPASDTLTGVTRQGVNDFRKIGYGGPCPPGGTHRYYFKLYALETLLPVETAMTKAMLLKAMEGQVIAEGTLMGKYTRKR